MARYGKQPVTVPQGVNIQVEGTSLTVKGPKGEVTRALPRFIEIVVKDGEVLIEKTGNSKQAASNQGTMRSHVSNMVKGVSELWSRSMEIVGAGFRAEVKGNQLVMQIGYSHPVIIDIPSTMSAKVEKSIVTVSGADKEEVGHIAALIRGSRPPEPYKGTGIKYTDEVIRRKAGKQAAK
jgi:large subunit ribosomal protein L6